MKLSIGQTLLYICASAGLLMAGCAKQSVNENLGSLPSPAFTVTPLATNPNQVVFKSTTPGAFLWKWDFGGSGSSVKESDTFLFMKKGDYNVVLKAFNRAGFASATQKVSIAADFLGINALKGSEMNAASASSWTVQSTGNTLTTLAWGADGLKFSNGTGSAQTNVVVWQAVTVKAGKNYKFSANVKGSGATNTWFEIYLGTAAPVAGADYTDNKYIALSTWDGCATSTFNDNLANIGCVGNGKGKAGAVTFATAGTVYVVIKGGSWDGNMGATGVTISDVRLAELP
ncbi:MAG: hypothetical protein QM731_12630 [Chitinophagaceae bacterium]